MRSLTAHGWEPTKARTAGLRELSPTTERGCPGSLAFGDPGNHKGSNQSLRNPATAAGIPATAVILSESEGRAEGPAFALHNEPPTPPASHPEAMERK